MVQYLQKRWQEHRDQPIWETIREPKYKLHHIDGSGEHHDKQCELPYSLDDLTKKFGRSWDQSAVHLTGWRGAAK